MAEQAEADEALAWVMNEGHFDNIRKKVMDSLRQNENLKAQTLDLLDESKTLASTDLSTANPKKVLEDLRKELEDKILGVACKEAQGIMLDPSNSICNLIEDTTHEALCVLYGNRAEQRQGDEPAQAHTQALAPSGQL